MTRVEYNSAMRILTAHDERDRNGSLQEVEDADDIKPMTSW